MAKTNIHKPIKKLYKHHQEFWTRGNILSFAQTIGLFILALVIQKLADVYVGHVNGVVVPDLILDRLPTLDIDTIVVQGALLLTFIAIGLLIYKPKYISFTLKAFSIFIITRSFFISLTHLGVSPHELVLDKNSFGFGLYNLLYNSKGDFFFSGHTGAPFLLALIFWKEKWWRIFFLCTSFIFACSVLLAHIHYSIDVFAAPFMTYGIFTISKTLFPQDYKTTDPGEIKPLQLN